MTLHELSKLQKKKRLGKFEEENTPYTPRPKAICPKGLTSITLSLEVI
jgi:hypothetical protein